MGPSKSGSDGNYTDRQIREASEEQLEQWAASSAEDLHRSIKQVGDRIDNVWWTLTQGHPPGCGLRTWCMQHAAKAVMKSLAPEHFSREDLDATSQFASSSRHARTSNSRQQPAQHLALMVYT
jgi:hypothetical protein